MNFEPRESEAPFGVEEYAERVTRVRAEMERCGIDLLYATAPESLYYLSGFRALWFQTLSLGGWEPISGIAIGRDFEEPIHFECDREQALTNLTAVSRDVRIWPIGRGSFLDFIVDELRSSGRIAGTVGLEQSHYRPYPSASARMAAAFETAGSRVIDATEVLTRVRRNKSTKERAYTRKAAEICDVGMRAAIDSLRPGMTELDLYAEVIYAMSRAGGENPSITIPVQSGSRTVAAHSLPSRKVIESGEVLNLDVCGVYNRYHADNARTFSLGAPDPEMARVVAASCEAFDILERAMRPDCLLNDVLPELQTHYEKTGLWGGQRWAGGYELGVAFPPDWVGAFSYTVGEDMGDARFEVGLVSNYESNFYLPDRPGMSMMIDTLIVDEDGAGWIHDIPHELIVIE
jgi:Xaa-Pro aminopeptidase